ncbi:MAG: flagellar motor switch protein FliN [Candidatus Eremiobacteraeota bacterium]|nr:flagellar motor switch protein FliN [Candidatus Eremiobacteraeota bacterium]MBV8373093.1 flagellar motor switch protein FliN [Candidatus Eremiobacteraeota bacterium]
MTYEASDGARQLEILMRVPLRLTAEVGRRQMSISEVLKLGNGSVVELDRPAGDPVDLFAGDRLIARGEIVAIGQNFGVRITELIGRS